MRRLNYMFLIFAFAAFAGAPARAGAYPQAQTGSGTDARVVDRIVARIEDDIILESQVRELGKFQQLVEGRQETDNRLLAELIEQWVVETEATTARFTQPAQSEVDQELARLAAQFPTPVAYSMKLRELGLTAGEVRQMLARQLFVERYLDYKFRPTVQIEAADIQSYYEKEFSPELTGKNQAVPKLEQVEAQIRELLTQRQISDLAAKWLDETKSHLKIELALNN